MQTDPMPVACSRCPTAITLAAACRSEKQRFVVVCPTVFQPWPSSQDVFGCGSTVCNTLHRSPVPAGHKGQWPSWPVNGKIIAGGQEFDVVEYIYVFVPAI